MYITNKKGKKIKVQIVPKSLPDDLEEELDYEMSAKLGRELTSDDKSPIFSCMNKKCSEKKQETCSWSCKDYIAPEPEGCICQDPRYNEREY